MARLRSNHHFLAVVCVGFCYIFLNKALFYDLENAFLMSIVYCDDPTPPCPPGSVQLEDACVAEPPSSPKWSFSKHCSVRNYVLNAAKSAMSMISTADGVGSVVAVVFLGPLLDWHGRKTFILLAIAGSMVRPVMQFVSSLLIGHTLTQDAINAAGATISAMLSVFPAAIAAMVADLSENQIQMRNHAMSVLSQALFLAGALGFVGGFGILHQNLENYSWYWLLSAGLNVVLFVATLCLVAETKHLANSPSQGADSETESEASTNQEPSTSVTSADSQEKAQTGRGALRDLLRFLRDVRHDSVLLQILILNFILKAVWSMEHLARFMLITYLDYSQAAASLVGFVSTICGVAGSRLSTLLLPRLGVWTTLFLALCMGIVGSALEGVAVLIAENEMSLLPSLVFWTGKVILGICLGIRTPLLDTLASVRVEKDQQGRLFSIMQLMELAGHTIGMSLLYPRLYNSTWSGWMAPLSSFVGMGFYVFCSCWVLCLRCQQQHASGTPGKCIGKETSEKCCSEVGAEE